MVRDITQSVDSLSLDCFVYAVWQTEIKWIASQLTSLARNENWTAVDMTRKKRRYLMEYTDIEQSESAKIKMIEGRGALKREVSGKP